MDVEIDVDAEDESLVHGPLVDDVEGVCLRSRRPKIRLVGEAGPPLPLPLGWRGFLFLTACFMTSSAPITVSWLLSSPAVLSACRGQIVRHE